MKIAVLGTGMVGNTIGSKLISLGHEVKMGSRSATNEKALAWIKYAGPKALAGTFADAAAADEHDVRGNSLWTDVVLNKENAKFLRTRFNIVSKIRYDGEITDLSFEELRAPFVCD